MMTPLLIAVAMFIPMDPQSDQAVLDGLAARGFDVAVASAPADTAQARSMRWQGLGCVGQLEMRQGWESSQVYWVDWGRVKISSEPRVVRLDGASRTPDRPVPEQLTLTFADPASAALARGAMNRLRTACEPQR